MEKIVYLTKQEFDELIVNKRHLFTYYIPTTEPILDSVKRNVECKTVRYLEIEGIKYVEDEQF